MKPAGPSGGGGACGVGEAGTGGSSLRSWARDAVANGSSVLGEGEVRTWLGESLPFGPAVLCATPDEAADAAERVGFPVVVKVMAPGVLHKSDLGLVTVGIATPSAVREAATAMLHEARSLGFADAMVSVQQQLGGVEAAIGIRRDTLGPVCMVAGGGTLIELIGDVALGMAPLGEIDAASMVERLALAKLLGGYRGSAPVDKGSLVDLLVKVSQLALEVPELTELDLNPVFVQAHGCQVADARAVLTAFAPDAEETGFADLRSFLGPRRVAVVGASSDQRKVGGLLLKYLRKHSFDGEIVAVHPGGSSIDGVRTVAAIGECELPVDLACIAVPARAVESAFDDCVEANVPAGIVYSSGFAEAGEDGRAAQERLVARARGRLRFLGPNSMGVAVPSRGYFATFGMALEADEIPAGPVGFVSQSGAIASSLFSRSAELGTGFSHWVSVGNEADVGVADAIAHLAGDESCKVICLFLEAVRRPRAFAEAVESARAARKAVIAFKTGRSEAGRAAAASHTGALTGSDEAYTAFFERHGVIQTRSLPGLFVAAQGVLTLGPVPGRRVGVVSMSGGACSILADACVSWGLELPALSNETQKQLREVLPAFAGVRNPVDVTAAGIQRPHMVRDALSVIRSSDEVDVVLVQLSTNADPAAALMAADLLELRAVPGPPFAIGRLGSPLLAPVAVSAYGEAGMHVFTWPDELAEAAAASAVFGEILRRSDLSVSARG